MKDIVISAKCVKKEIVIYATCFLLAFLTNVFSIIYFNTEWSELFQYLGYVVVLSIVFYVVALLARGVVWSLQKIVRKN